MRGTPWKSGVSGYACASSVPTRYTCCQGHSQYDEDTTSPDIKNESRCENAFREWCISTNLCDGAKTNGVSVVMGSAAAMIALFRAMWSIKKMPSFSSLNHELLIGCSLCFRIPDFRGVWPVSCQNIVFLSLPFQQTFHVWFRKVASMWLSEKALMLPLHYQASRTKRSLEFFNGTLMQSQFSHFHRRAYKCKWNRWDPKRKLRVWGCVMVSII